MLKYDTDDRLAAVGEDIDEVSVGAHRRVGRKVTAVLPLGMRAELEAEPEALALGCQRVQHREPVVARQDLVDQDASLDVTARQTVRTEVPHRCEVAERHDAVSIGMQPCDVPAELASHRDVGVEGDVPEAGTDRRTAR